MYLIAELCGQHGGSLRRLEQMALQVKMAGGDAVKLQLYDTYKMPGENRERWEYLDISFDNLKKFKQYCDHLHLDLFASFFDEERLQWCLDLNFNYLKIASFVLHEWPELVTKTINTNRQVLVSLGMHDWKTNGIPYEAHNVKYLHCVPRYPGTLEDQKMINFQNHPFFVGYSDHTPGITAVCTAITQGAKIIEKHYTTSKSLQQDTEKGHFCAMDQQELMNIRTFSDEFEILKRYQ